MKTNSTLMYRIDENDKIVFVNQQWLSFALDSVTPELTPEKVVGQSLWNFISCDTSAEIYKEIIGKVRMGETSNFTFRCDSSACQRQMEMTVSSVENDEVQFDSETVWQQEREAQPLLDPFIARTDEFLLMCSWCKCINVGLDQWKEVEEAVIVLNLFEQTELPQITHGICEDCYQKMSETIRNRKKA